MATVRNIDRKGQVIEDLTKVVINLDEFPEVVQEVRRLAKTFNERKESA